VTARRGSPVAARHGRLTLLLCAVQFLGVASSSVTYVALPPIRRDRGSSVQHLQRALAGYLITRRGCRWWPAPGRRREHARKRLLPHPRRRAWPGP
jgi:hypothetical protein